MFVFGEVQDPLPETVNLVEDIVRSQLIELVRTIIVPNFTASSLRLSLARRFCKRALWLRVVVLATCPQRILSFSFVMTEEKSIDFEHICPGRMFENMQKTRVGMVVLEWKSRTWKMAQTVS